MWTPSQTLGAPRKPPTTGHSGKGPPESCSSTFWPLFASSQEISNAKRKCGDRPQPAVPHCAKRPCGAPDRSNSSAGYVCMTQPAQSTPENASTVHGAEPGASRQRSPGCSVPSNDEAIDKACSGQEASILASLDTATHTYRTLCSGRGLEKEDLKSAWPDEVVVSTVS